MTLSLHQKIVAIMSEVSTIGKSGYNQRQEYKYTEAVDVIREVRRLMVAYQLRLKSEVLERKREEVSPKAKLTVLTIRYTIIDTESGEMDTTTITAEGMDSGDKGNNKAMTAGLKYFFRDTFLLEFADDPEKEEKLKPTKQLKQNKQPQQPVKYVKEPPVPPMEKTKHQKEPVRNLDAWKEMAGKQRKRFFAIANKKGLTDKQQKALAFFYTGKLSRSELNETEFQMIADFLDGANKQQIDMKIAAAKERKEAEGVA